MTTGGVAGRGAGGGTRSPDASIGAPEESNDTPVGSAKFSYRSLFTLERLIERITASPRSTPIFKSKSKAINTTSIDAVLPFVVEKQSRTVAGVTITM